MNQEFGQKKNLNILNYGLMSLSWAFIFFLAYCTNFYESEHVPSIIFIFFASYLAGTILCNKISHDSPERKFLVHCFSWSFIIRVIVVLSVYLVLYSKSGFPFMNFGPRGIGADDERDYYAALYFYPMMENGNIIEAIRHVKMPASGQLETGFPFLLALIYSIFGKAFILSLVLNAFISSLIPIILYKLSIELSLKREASKKIAIMGLWNPGLISYVSYLTKDMLVTFLSILAAFPIIRLIRGKHSLREILSFGFLAVVFLYIRTQVAVIWAVIFLISLLYGRKVETKLVYGTIGIAIVSITFYLRRSDLMEVWNFSKDYYFLSQGLFGSGSMVEKAQGLVASDSTIRWKILEFPFYLRFPTSLIYSFIAPFPPWRVPITNGIYGVVCQLPEVIFMYLFLPHILLGGWWIIRNKKKILYPILIYTSVIMLSIALFYYGGGGRYRVQIMPFLLIFLVLGKIQYGGNKANIAKAFYAMGFIGGVLFYIYLRYLKFGL